MHEGASITEELGALQEEFAHLTVLLSGIVAKKELTDEEYDAIIKSGAPQRKIPRGKALIRTNKEGKAPASTIRAADYRFGQLLPMTLYLMISSKKAWAIFIAIMFMEVQYKLVYAVGTYTSYEILGSRPLQTIFGRTLSKYTYGPTQVLEFSDLQQVPFFIRLLLPVELEYPVDEEYNYAAVETYRNWDALIALQTPNLQRVSAISNVVGSLTVQGALTMLGAYNSIAPKGVTFPRVVPPLIEEWTRNMVHFNARVIEHVMSSVSGSMGKVASNIFAVLILSSLIGKALIDNTHPRVVAALSFLTTFLQYGGMASLSLALTEHPILTITGGVVGGFTTSYMKRFVFEQIQNKPRVTEKLVAWTGDQKQIAARGADNVKTITSESMCDWNY